jgi:hypothetical protein
MKKLYLIQYRNHNVSLEEKIKSLGSWIKYFSDNWIVESELSSKDIYGKLSFENDKNSLLIIELKEGSNFYGRMNPKVWEYLKKKNRE